MKVLFFLSHLQSGGAERTVSYLSSYLSDNGYNVTVLLLENSIFYELNKKTKVVTLNIPSKPKNVFHKLYLGLKRYVKIKKAIKKEKPDCVFCMIGFNAKYMINSKRNYKLITSERNRPEVGDVKLKERIFSRSDGVVFQTQRAMDFYTERIKVNGVVIHNAVGNDLVYNITPCKERKDKITAMGRLNDQKDYPTLLKAFALFKEEHPTFSLEIFGSGDESYKNKLIALCKELKIEKDVFFMGSHKDAIVKASDSACYVMSSKFEGMPNALMEAMGAGIPSISTDCPNGPAELIKDGENGLLVSVGDINALSNAMKRVVEDKELADKLSKNGREILKTHSISIKAKEYADFIEKTIEKQGT